ncbi:hypothetical protein CUMW_242530 [Citrus unshiu]|uniref:Uncharacterized protein n=1 Tax=Citrus unshiu TaxID=55188 RepID=A0A2H5QLX0_CITUN|nr:hypothetical protein CUMW_242530 [Citrus unshiu]
MVSLRRTDGDSTISISSSAETSSRIRSDSFTEPLLPGSKDCSNSIEMRRTGSLSNNLVGDNAHIMASDIIRCTSSSISGKAEINLKMVFNPTTIAAAYKSSLSIYVFKVVGLIIRIVPPIRKAMIGDNALLRLIDNSASLLGEAAIPSIILLLGANL